MMHDMINMQHINSKGNISIKIKQASQQLKLHMSNYPYVLCQVFNGVASNNYYSEADMHDNARTR